MRVFQRCAKHAENVLHVHIAKNMGIYKHPFMSMSCPRTHFVAPGTIFLLQNNPSQRTVTRLRIENRQPTAKSFSLFPVPCSLFPCSLFPCSFVPCLRRPNLIALTKSILQHPQRLFSSRERCLGQIGTPAVLSVARTALSRAMIVVLLNAAGDCALLENCWKWKQPWYRPLLISPNNSRNGCRAGPPFARSLSSSRLPSSF